MVGTTNFRTLRKLGEVILAWAFAWCCLSSSPAATLGTGTAADIQPIAEVRSLPVAELATNPPIRIRGVVTLRGVNSIVIQDNTAGIYVNFDFARKRGVWEGDGIPDAVHVGDEIEIDGTIDPGGFSPPVLPREVRVLGSQPLPPARQTDPERFFSGAVDSLLTELTGVVHGITDDGSDWRLNLEAAGHPFVAVVTKSAIPDDPQQLVDAEVRLTGVPLSIFNTRGEFLQPLVMVGRPEWFTIVSPPPHPPFDCPPVAISSLARFRPEPFRGHRIRTQGVVIHSVPGQAVHLQDGAGGVRAATRSIERFTPGDRVEVAGFVDRSGRVAGLTDAILQKTHSGPPPNPTMITPDEIVALNTKSTQSAVMARPGDYEGCLIRFPARLLEARVSNDGGLLVLSAGKTSVVAVAELADFLSPQAHARQRTGGDGHRGHRLEVRPNSVAGDDPRSDDGHLAIGRRRVAPPQPVVVDATATGHPARGRGDGTRRIARVVLDAAATGEDAGHAACHRDAVPPGCCRRV